MAKRYSVLAGKELEYEDPFVNQDEVEDLREKLALCQQNCTYAEQRWARALDEIGVERAKRDAAELQITLLNQRVIAAESERAAALSKCNDMGAQLHEAQCCAREAEDRANKAEVMAAERADAMERMVPNDNTELLNAIKQSIQIPSNPIAPLPAFQLSFTRGANGLIKSPVTATPIN